MQEWQKLHKKKLLGCLLVYVDCCMLIMKALECKNAFLGTNHECFFRNLHEISFYKSFVHEWSDDCLLLVTWLLVNFQLIPPWHVACFAWRWTCYYVDWFSRLDQTKPQLSASFNDWVINRMRGWLPCTNQLLGRLDVLFYWLVDQLIGPNKTMMDSFELWPYHLLRSLIDCSVDYHAPANCSIDCHAPVNCSID